MSTGTERTKYDTKQTGILKVLAVQCIVTTSFLPEPSNSNSFLSSLYMYICMYIPLGVGCKFQFYVPSTLPSTNSMGRDWQGNKPLHLPLVHRKKCLLWEHLNPSKAWKEIGIVVLHTFITYPLTPFQPFGSSIGVLSCEFYCEAPMVNVCTCSSRRVVGDIATS